MKGPPNADPSAATEFREAEKRLEAFRKKELKFQGAPEQIRDVVEKFTAEAKAICADYDTVGATGGASWRIVSLARSGDVYSELAEKLIKAAGDLADGGKVSGIACSTNRDDCGVVEDQFADAVYQFVPPFEEEAQKRWKDAVSLASQVGEWKDAGSLASQVGVASDYAAKACQRRAAGTGNRGVTITLGGPLETALDLIDVVNSYPKDWGASTALNNACILYEKICLFGQAAQCYERLYADYPDSEWGKEALWNASRDHARFFEFDRAVEGYMTVAKDPKFASSEHRVEALGFSASLLDDDQQYTRAADIYKKYSDAIASKPRDSAQAYFFACNAYEKGPRDEQAVGLPEGLHQEVQQAAGRRRVHRAGLREAGRDYRELDEERGRDS
jgi:hypothetical protein